MTFAGVAAGLRFSSLLAPALRSFYEGVAGHIERSLGRPVEFVEGDQERFDLAFVCSPIFLRDPRLVALAAPVPSGERYGGRPEYFSDVIVAADHEAESIADLAGVRWAFNETDSYSGFGALAWLAHVSRDPLAGRLLETGSHAASIEAVAAKRVDAAAIDSLLLDMLRRDDAEAVRRIRVVGSLGPAPIQPLVARTSVPVSTRTAVAEAVVTMHEHDPSSLRSAGVSRFVAVARRDYAVVEARLDVIAEAAAAVS